MPDPLKVLKVLRESRSRVEVPEKWFTPARWALGLADWDSCCAITALPDLLADEHNGLAADALARGMGLENVCDIPEWNDSHTHAEVLAAFDRAIAIVEAGPTPNADTALDVMAACDIAAGVVARYIVSEHPGMDLMEIQTLVSAELFYAAQDTARTVDLGIWTERA